MSHRPTRSSHARDFSISTKASNRPSASLTDAPVSPRSHRPGGTTPLHAGPPPSSSRPGNPVSKPDRRVTTTTTTTIATNTALLVTKSAQRKPNETREVPSAPNRDKPRSGPFSSNNGIVSWSPEVSLRQQTTAPLASRTTYPPLSNTITPVKGPTLLEQMSPEAQEAAVIEDLLFCFMGFEGQFLRFKEEYNPVVEAERLAGPQFRIPIGLEPSIKDILGSLLKVARHYAALDAFVEVQSRDEFGAINHALCSAIRKLLKDYLVLIAQLEHQFLSNPSFTLHTLHLSTIPVSHTLSQLYSLAQEILRRNSLLEDDDLDSAGDDVELLLESLRDGANIAGGGPVMGRKVCKGGAVLDLITNRLNSMAGDPSTRSLLEYLLRQSSMPYMVMLNEWLHHGVIKDAHSEFLIKETKSIRRERLEEDYTDEYWDKRYTIRHNDVPPQLEAVKEKVLLAGKYLNVVRECGGVDVSKEVKDVPLTFDDPNFLDNVGSAYAHANESLLNLLLTTHGLRARLRSLKHYFFLDQSDFFSYFLELGTSELKKPAKNVNVAKLQSLLDLTLRQPGSIAAGDPFKEDVRVQMNEIGLTKWLMRIVSVSGVDEGSGLPEDHRNSSNLDDDKSITGFNAMELDFAVPFPLSLVISRKTILRYQLIFRYLLSLRHLEILLVGAWQDHTKVISWRHHSRFLPIERWKRGAFTLRARMLVFVQQLLYFCTAEVLEPNWHSLQERIGSVKTVDELMQNHVDFLDTCLKECMLTNSKLLKIHAKIMQTCTMFASYTSHLSRALVSADPSLNPSNSGAISLGPDEAAKVEKLSDNLKKYEENFSRHLKILLDALNYYAATETVVLLGLCARLSTANDGNAVMNSSLEEP
ncbi:hypothetical protein TWF173_009109 [Orbilia oligospora]|uniref:Spindle pole body component n=2 Tax=Orbilia oligospora TaxID=2813651 RepID=G1XCH5_ARTOA|nr:hypothetical protein AOL_s00079g10 [Orbilia oligospora ATCC 24927]EGX49138.1 hypothetical protein AOL_s00079g10 [Orbilia oligospora ATCC 24927]KAF3269775.1 hypothetical protein TWF970_010891 [Orbilia oligospora]KAF3269776.1 hypothetical protein TWF970_010891 [Orbilia oligospora]KAF3310867.1 hypothetical protein TWF173_009109 [Orbilia oligospora]